MTLANKITIFRILLIPLFVWLTLDYIASHRAGKPHGIELVLACVIFAVASVSDGVDGYIARRFNQKTELGTFLDPLADKALLISALVLLSRDTGGAFVQLPLWFPVLVISRDIILLGGTLLIHLIVGHVKSQPRFVGKLATFFQMLTLGWVLLRLPAGPFLIWLYAAGLFTLASGIWYVFDGIQQLNAAPHKKR